jgi:hypothetical protein
MGVVRTLRGEDGKPYISIEDMIGELNSLKKINNSILDNGFIDTILKTLIDMENQYYEKFLCRNDDDGEIFEK